MTIIFTFKSHLNERSQIKGDDQLQPKTLASGFMFNSLVVFDSKRQDISHFNLHLYQSSN